MAVNRDVQVEIFAEAYRNRNENDGVNGYGEGFAWMSALLQEGVFTPVTRTSNSNHLVVI